MILRRTRADKLGCLPFTSFAASTEALRQLDPVLLPLVAPDSLIAADTRHIRAASQDLLDSYTGRIFVGRDDGLRVLDAWLDANDAGLVAYYHPDQPIAVVPIVTRPML